MSPHKEQTEQGTGWSTLRSQDLGSRREGLKGQLHTLAPRKGTTCPTHVGSTERWNDAGTAHCSRVHRQRLVHSGGQDYRTRRYWFQASSVLAPVTHSFLTYAKHSAGKERHMRQTVLVRPEDPWMKCF